MNLLLSTDSYKQSHFLQYPPGTEYITAYIEPRLGGPGSDQMTMFFGLQAFIDKYLLNPVSSYDIQQAATLAKSHGVPFNEAGWRHIVEQYAGYLPLAIQALPEGTVVNRGVPVVQVTNTDPRCAWLVTFIETALLRAIWYPSTVATSSFLVKVSMAKALRESADSADGLPFMLHDFGARGVSSGESAAIGGLAHLVNFTGTDTMEALEAAQRYYSQSGAAGFSVPASEHSTITSWGREFEDEAISNMIDQFGGGVFSVVSDSYDLWNAVDTIIGHKFRDRILSMPGKLVVRPDSGNPVSTPVEVIEHLWSHFGGEINSKGYKVLHPKVGVLQGDGLNPAKIQACLAAVMGAGFSAQNIVFGMGGGLLQAVGRDDHRFAMKANAIKFDVADAWTDVQKAPVTDPSKASKGGRQAVVVGFGGDELVAVREDSLGEKDQNLLLTVWRNGGYVQRTNLDEVRGRASEALTKFVEGSSMAKAA